MFDIKDGFELDNVYPFNIIKEVNRVYGMCIWVNDINIRKFFDYLADLGYRERLVTKFRFKDKLTYEECGKRINVSGGEANRKMLRVIRKISEDYKSFMSSEYIQECKDLSERIAEDALKNSEEYKRFLQKEIKDLPICNRSINALVYGKRYKYISDIINKDYYDLNNIYGIGQDSIRELLDCLEKMKNEVMSKVEKDVIQCGSTDNITETNES